MHDAIDRVIADRLGVEMHQLTADATFESLGADSLDTLELSMAFEDQFHIEITDEEANAAVTVGDLHALIARKTLS